jgi:hypothetical protein
MSVAVHYENFMTTVFEAALRKLAVNLLLPVHCRIAFSWRIQPENRTLAATPGTRTPRVTC